MDLGKALLPDSVEVSGEFFPVQTGHSFWFRFAQVSILEKVYLNDFDFLYVAEIPENKQEGAERLFDFFHEKKEIPRSENEPMPRVIDYDIDSDLIYSAILQCYGIDLYEKQIHWHKVRAMIAGLTGTRLNDIMSYRCSTDTKNKELQRLKRIWALPELMTSEDKEALDRFNAQFE